MNKFNNLTEIELFMLTSCLGSTVEDGRWDDTPEGQELQEIQDKLYESLQNEIHSRGYNDIENFDNKYRSIYEEDEDGGHYQPH